MTHHKPIPQELLDQLEYDETSPTLLRWKEGGKGRRPDRQAGCQTPQGYHTVSYGPAGRRTMYRAHRIIWAMHHDDPLDMVVDHVDNDPSNSRIGNLQLVLGADNQTRITGRGYTRHAGKWQAQLSLGGKCIYLGRFDTEEEARAAYVKAKKETTEGLQVELD